MKFIDTESSISIDSEFPCGSCGAVRKLENMFYEVSYQPEIIPAWFQDLLDKLFEGAGVPKEYMSHVRVGNSSTEIAHVKLRFLLSPTGANYMHPPWWKWRQDVGWSCVPPQDTALKEHSYVDISLQIQPGEILRIASAPYEDPAVIIEKCQQLAENSRIWNYREIGTTVQGRPIPLLESEPRELKLLIDASMQSAEPVSCGILHVAHSLTIPTARNFKLLDRVQFNLLPITNPDGAFLGRSVTNSRGEVPKFGINRLVDDQNAESETEALWNHMIALRPDVAIEVHAHFTRADFTRSIGMHDKRAIRDSLHHKASVLERHLLENYVSKPLKNRMVLVDPEIPELAVYGDKHISDRAGAIRTWIQALPDSIDTLSADVREMVDVVANALIEWQNKHSS